MEGGEESGTGRNEGERLGERREREIDSPRDT